VDAKFSALKSSEVTCVLIIVLFNSAKLARALNFVKKFVS
jgi:hypothetical protein